MKRDSGSVENRTTGTAGDWRLLRDGSAEQILEWSAKRWQSKVAIFTAFQAEGMVIIDLASRLELDLRVLTIDTGRLPEETFRHWEVVRSRYGVDIEVIMPEARAVEQMVDDYGPNLFRIDKSLRNECCRVRKVEPFRKAVAGLSAWISGVRRTQSRGRSETSPFQLDAVNDPTGRLIKVSPLVDWSMASVWSYLERHEVPRHPLYEQGYHSIGCAPCSRPMRPNEDPRATRWWWEDGEHRECGLHHPPVGVGRGDRQ